jgi:hypothetical protein
MLATSSGGGRCVTLKRIGSLFRDLISFVWLLLYTVVVLPFQIAWTVVRTILQVTFNYFPLVVLLFLTAGFTVAWVGEHTEIMATIEVSWRCTIQPIFLEPIPAPVRALITPYEEGICYSNALGFTNRVLSSKTITRVLAEDPNKLSLWHPVVSLLKGIFDSIARIGRWLVGFYKNRFPAYSIARNVEALVEVFMRLLNALCRDLHPGFFYLGRVITNSRLFCVVDNFVNAAVARVQYWLTYSYDFITTILSLIVDASIFDFTSFIDEFRTKISDVSPVFNVPSERIAMALIHLGEYLNEVIYSLICTIITEIEHHKNDSTLTINGTVPPPHTSFPLGANETYLHEPLYEQCMATNTSYHINLFGALAHLSATIPRFQFTIERTFPGSLFRIAWEFLFLSGPVSDDGSLGYDINTPIPNNSTRYLLNGFTIDAVWDTLRRPLDTLRTTSTIERWPYPALYGKNSPLYDPMENTTSSCGNTTYVTEPQDNLFCKECYYNRSEANVVTQLEILANDIDDLLEGLINRRLARPLLYEIFGGIIRVFVAILKFFFDVPRHVLAGFDEALIFFSRQNYYDNIFDEFGGKDHQLGGILNGIVNFFAQIHPSLHIVPKFVVLPVKVVVEFVRNIIRLVPMLLNTLIGINGAPTYGPRINEFFCLTGSPTCINVEEQFIKWLRTPRSISEVQIIINALRRPLRLFTSTSGSGENTSAGSATTIPVFNLGIHTLDTAHIDAVFDMIANNYTNLLYGDVYDPDVIVPPSQFGWLECFRYLLSPSFVNSFIDNPLDHITPEQFPDITCGIYYGGRFVVELGRAVLELAIALLQTVFDLFSNTDPFRPAVILRWLACTEPATCIPLLQSLSDTEDFVQCPCRLLGDTFLDVPCLCNITNGLGLTANQLLRASLNVELAASQLIVCITEFPNGVTSNASSEACYTIVFDRVIDIFTKSYNATNDASLLGGGIGCLIGLTSPGNCGSKPLDQSFSSYTSDLGYYLVQFVFSIIRSVLRIVEKFFVFIRDTVLGNTPSSNPSSGFTLRSTVETILNETVTPLVGDPSDSNSVGFIQTLGLAWSCLFGTTACNLEAMTNECPGWFLFQLGNNLRDAYLCLLKIIGNFIGFFENLFSGQDVGSNVIGFFDGIICLIGQLAQSILDLFVSIIGGLLDAILGTGTTITTFLSSVVDSVTSVINILQGLFFDVGEALDCSTCWSDCLFQNWDADHPFGPSAPQTTCNDCYCECKCQRPTLPGLPCRVDWDGNGDTDDSEVFTPENPTLGFNCTAAKKKRDQMDPLEGWFADESEVVSYNPISFKPTQAAGSARNIYMTLKTWKEQRAAAVSPHAPPSDTLCSQFLASIYEKHASTPSNFDSIDKLLALSSYSDRVLFKSCYSLLIAPSLFNARTQSHIQVPKNLFMDGNQLKWWVHSSLDLARAYTTWSTHQGNIEVSPTMLQALIQAKKNHSVVVYNADTLSTLTYDSTNVLRRFTSLMHRNISNSLISVHATSFADALILGGATRNPNMRIFAEQLSDYANRGRTTKRVAQNLGRMLTIAQQSTLLDGLISTVRGLRESLTVVTPMSWSRAVQNAIRTSTDATCATQSSVKMISDSFTHPQVFTQQGAQFGPFGNRNNSNFRVLAGTMRVDKLQNLVSFYGRVWNHYKQREVSSANTRITAAINGIKKQLTSSETVLRAVETYEVIQNRIGTHLNFPPLDPRITAWVASVRTHPVKGLDDTQIASLLNNTECNVTRCFQCAVLDTVVTEIRDYFQFCIDRDQGLDVVRKINFTTVDDVVDAIDTGDHTNVNVPSWVFSNGFLFGLGRYLNTVGLFITSLNVDPFNRTGESVGLWFYISNFLPIPFVGTCDRDLHTMCQLGLGFGWGLAILAIMTIGGILLWAFLPPIAGVLANTIAILGYIIVTVTLVTTISWGMNPFCLQSPGLSLISVVAPIQTPILPECAVRDISRTLDAIFVPCFDFLKYLMITVTDPFTCPSCPVRLPFVDCRTSGFETMLDILAFGGNWVLYKTGLRDPGVPLIPMNSQLRVTDAEHFRCFLILGAGTSVFWLSAALITLLYLIPMLIEIGMLLYNTALSFWNASLFTRTFS